MSPCATRLLNEMLEAHKLYVELCDTYYADRDEQIAKDAYLKARYRLEAHIIRCGRAAHRGVARRKAVQKARTTI